MANTAVMCHPSSRRLHECSRGVRIHPCGPDLTEPVTGTPEPEAAPDRTVGRPPADAADHQHDGQHVLEGGGDFDGEIGCEVGRKTRIDQELLV